jgi:hypothetical protein
VTARTQPRTLADLIGDLPPHNYRVGYLIGDLARLGDAQRALLGGYTLAEVDFDSAEAAALSDEFVERLTERLCARFANNPRVADLLHLAVCEPEAMTSADRQAVEPFAPFLAFAAPVIVAAAALESAFDTVLFQPEADKAREEESRRWHAHLDLECLRAAFAPVIAALATLIGDLAAGRVTLPPFDPRIIAEREALVEAHRAAVIAAGGALGNRSQAFAPSKLPHRAADPGDDDGLLPWETSAAAADASSSASPSTDAASDPDEAFELAEARVIAADAALVEARAAVTSALLKIPGRLIADFVAVVSDTEAARRAALAAERNRDACEGELGCDNGADEHSLSVASDKLTSAHLALLNFSLREADFVGDALSSLE